jgi:hypothetical protein
MQKKQTCTPSPDLQLMSKSEMMDETLEEDSGLAFNIEMDLEFDVFCMEQLENELSIGEPQLMPDNEINDDLWVCPVQSHFVQYKPTNLETDLWSACSQWRGLGRIEP